MSLRDRCRRTFAKAGWALATLFILGLGVAQATTYVYDSNGRLRAATNSTGASAEYVYDAMGNLLQVESVPVNQLAIFVFSPSHGAIGTRVTIEGQGFSATAADDTVKFNGTTATVTQATTTTLTTTVPTGATTGTITVTVGSNSATSADAFTVDTTGLPPVITSFSPTIGGPGTNVTVVGKNLDPVSNQSYPAIDGTRANPTSASQTQVVFPVTSVMGSGKVSVTTPFGLGTSTADFFVIPPGISTANVAVTKRVAVGGSVALSIPAGKYAAILFDANAGSWLSFQTSGITSTANAIAYTIYDGHNKPLMSGTITSASPSIHIPVIHLTGTYSIWIKPDTASATLTLGLESDGTLSMTGKGTAISTIVTSQSKRLVFNASAAGNFGLGISGLTTSGSNDVSVAVYDVNGNFITDSSGLGCSPPNGCGINLTDLQIGSYQVLVTPSSSQTMSFTATVSQDLAKTLTVGTLFSLSIQRPGQNASLTFAATAGQTLTLQITNVITNPTGRAVSYTIYTPDGRQYAGGYFYTGTTAFNLPNLPQSGIYRIFIDPAVSTTCSEQLELISPSTLIVDGSSESLATVAPNENIYMNFTASTGYDLGMGLSNLNTDAIVNVYDSNRNFVAGTDCDPSSCDLDVQGLTSGVYQIVVSPYYSGYTLSFTATLSHDVTAPLSPNTPLSVNLTRQGQNASLQFSATAGQTLTLQFSGVATIPADSYVVYDVYTPDGKLYVSGGGTGFFAFNFPNLPQSGNYRVSIEPSFQSGFSSFSGQVTLVQLPLLAINGASQNFATTDPGQYVYLNFQASAGDNLGLGISGFTSSDSSSADVYVFSPTSNDEYIAHTVCSPSQSCGINLLNLPTSGIYTVEVDAPDSTATMGFSATLSSGATGVLPLNTAVPINLSRAGQTGLYTFTGDVGQAISLQIGGVITNPSNSAVLYTVVAPDGSQYAAASSSGSFSWDLGNLLQSGTYELQINPEGATYSAQLELEPGSTPELVAGAAPLYFYGTVGGESAYMGFAASAGANLQLAISGLSVTYGGYVTVHVYDGNGNTIATDSYCAPSGCTMNLNGLAAGNYQVVVAVQNSAYTMSFSASLSSQ